MNNFYLSLFIILLCCSLAAQVGINTTQFEPGVIFQVEGDGTQGVILTRSNIEDLNTEAPLPVGIEDGTLTFNTNTSTGLGYVWWDNATHTWKYVDPYIGKKVLFTNAVAEGKNGSQDFNVSPATPVQIKLFGTTLFNDEPDLYQVHTDKGLLIKADGRYKVMSAISIEGGFGNNTIESRVRIDRGMNTFYPGSFYESEDLGITNNQQDDDGSISFVEILELKKGDLVSMEVYGTEDRGAGQVVYFRSVGACTFLMIKIN
jgi:hypothetical protein